MDFLPAHVTPMLSLRPDLYAAHLSTLRQRAETALAKAELETLVVPSGQLHYQAFDDRNYPFAVNPQFKAWLPLTDAPGSWLVFTPGKRPELIYLQPLDYWHNSPADLDDSWARHFDVTVIREPGDALAALPEPSRCAILGEPQSALGPYVPNNPVTVLNYLDYHRAYKTAYEIEQLRQANLRAVRGHRAAARSFLAGSSEFGTHLAYCQAVGQDADALPYGNIVAHNRHAAILHYTERARLPPENLLSFLIDAGAQHNGYAADITRTHARDGHGDFQALIDAVDTAQRRLGEEFTAGRDFRELHLQAHLALAGVLRDAGVLTVSAEQAVDTGVSSAFFPHGLGHGIGLQVHDVAGFAASDEGGILDKPEGHPFLRLTRKLAPGMVVTNEPGIYFIELLLDKLRSGDHSASVDWARIEQFRPYGGIRIEDNIVVTDAEPLNLTREAFAQA